jgi:hypothetical protein
MSGTKWMGLNVRDWLYETKWKGPSVRGQVDKTKCTRTRVYCAWPLVWDQMNGTKCMGPNVRNKSISIRFLIDKTGKISLKTLPPRLKCFPSLFPKESFLSDLERTVLGGTRCRLGAGCMWLSTKELIIILKFNIMCWLEICDASLFHSSISLTHISIYSYIENLRQVVTKRCRLSWLTNSAFVYEPKCGGEGGAGPQPMSTEESK